LTQKQLTSTTLEQFRFALACAKQLDTQVETPLKLGNCAVLVELALAVELVVPVAAVPVPVEVDWSVIVVLPLVTSEDVEEGST